MAAAPPPAVPFGLSRRMQPSGPYTYRSMPFSPTARFNTISRSAPAYRKALDTRSSGLTRPNPGRIVHLRGIVRVITQDPAGLVLILGAASGQPLNSRALAAAVRPASRIFPNPYMLQGQEVLLSGTVSTYQDLPQIVLTQPNQVQIVH